MSATSPRGQQYPAPSLTQHPRSKEYRDRSDHEAARDDFQEEGADQPSEVSLVRHRESEHGQRKHDERAPNRQDDQPPAPRRACLACSFAAKSDIVCLPVSADRRRA